MRASMAAILMASRRASRALSKAAAGLPVNFSISGPGTLSSPVAITDSNGRAGVNVQAAGSTGAVTVTATSGSYSTTFSLTVIPAGPTLTTNSFYNGADFQLGSISPCGIATIIAKVNRSRRICTNSFTMTAHMRRAE